MSLHLFIDYIDVLGLLGGVVDFFHPSTCFQGYGTMKHVYACYSVFYMHVIVYFMSSYNIETLL